MDNALYKAFTGTYSELDAYLENATTIQLMADFRDMLRQLPGTADQDLKDFTKAAMQGLCQAAGSEIIKNDGLTQRQEDAIAYAALSIAERTLSELQKQQS